MKFRSKQSFFLLVVCCQFLVNAAFASAGNGDTLSGRIVEAKTNTPVCGAVVGLEGTFLWAVSDEDGRFVIERVQPGKYVLQTSCLGYVTRSLPISADRNTGPLTIRLTESSLAIDAVVVTAEEKKSEPNTTFIIGRNALDHLQMSGVSDVAALLPGGKTVNPDLTTETPFSLRQGRDDTGNAAFGTAVEVDGVRMGNNASFGAMDGVGTRSVAVTNIESIEVITGVPSAEYGDVNSGIVRIHTRKGRTPWNVQFAANPRTYQVSAAKGIDLEHDRGVLNVSAEWTRATRKLTSPYTSYSRRGLSLAYSNTFRKALRFEAGITGNIGGMNTEDDPDAYTGAYIRERDNVVRANTSLTWLVNKPWITNLRIDASLNFHDTRTHEHAFNSYASEQPAVHATQEGYFMAAKLPYTYFADRIEDSKELDYAASLKYEWNRNWRGIRNNLKAGVQWKASGNAGEGEYYENPDLAPTGYRPRPYSDYPYMHNLAVYVEERLTLPIGSTSLQLTAGLRMENLFIRNAQYDRMHTFSPRLNARWRFSKTVSIRGGWGVTEKLPSYYILYPRQQYRDIQTFGVSYNNNESTYFYYTQPYTMEKNPGLRWQRNRNAELGIEVETEDVRIAVTGYYNRTKFPYKYSNRYTPFSYDLLQLPDGYAMPSDPQFRVDRQTGMVYVRGSDSEYWTPMEVRVTDRTFVQSTRQDNGSDVVRCGVELVADLPEIKPIRTQFRIDGSYVYTDYADEGLSYSYRSGWSHTSLPNRSYQYVGVYANGGSGSVYNGMRTHSLDANLTAITRIPQARLVITCRLEMSLMKRSQRLSRYKGGEYAFNVSESDNTPAGGSIYDGEAYTAVYPVAYIDLDGVTHPFTETEASDPAFANLILKSGNAYTFAADGYDPYFSANLSITKEIGNHLSLSFFANNFTKSRPAVTSYATGVSAIFTPAFYYGLTCRLKF